MAAYETTLQMAQFSGVYQEGDGMNLNLKYATDAVNCDTAGGSLRPMRGGTKLAGELPAPVGTLMHLHRRFWPLESERDVLLAAAGTKLYYRLMSAVSWTEITGVAITNDDFDFVAYEKTRDGQVTPTDILLFTNADDGMFCFWGHDFSVTSVVTPHLFGVLARHAERIWGSGIKAEPDMLYYSAPYDPFNWAQNNEIPEDGAGSVSQPSWDGDSFVALRNYGSYLLAFKRERVWRVIGTDPGNYYLKEQYGGGAIVENTIVVNGGHALMLGYGGLMQYDGTEVTPFAYRAVDGILKRITPAAKDKACAIMRGRTFCLALPLDNATDNNAILEYDISDKSFNLRMGVYVKSFLRIRDQIYYTSAKSPACVYSLQGGSVLPLRWVSAYQDLNAKHVTKSGFTVYLSPETEAGALLAITIQTEKSIKTKRYVARPGGAVKRLMFGIRGRKFRIIIESTDTVEWRMTGGLQLSMELDED